MQAYAFETAIIMLYEEVYAKFELEGVDADTLDKINDLTEDYYQKYKEKLYTIIHYYILKVAVRIPLSYAP